MKRAILFLYLALLSAQAEEAIDPARAANTVVLDEAGVKNLRIETVAVEETEFEETVFSLGRLEVMPGKRAVVSSRIPGRATTVLALPDMRCQEGDELLWIESRQPGDPPPSVRVDAPMSGLIAEVNIVPGQPVTPEMALMEILDLSTLEAAASVPEHFAGQLKKGLKAHIRVPGFPDKKLEAELAHLGAKADGGTGTVEAAFHVANPGDELRPGMRAEFSIVLSKREGVTSVPREALQGDPAKRFVYVKDFELKNAFVKSPVEIGKANDRFVEIISGLLPGDEVVTRGAYSLAFAGGGGVSLKKALDDAHGHEHNADGSELAPEQKTPGAAKDDHDAHEHAEGGDWLWKAISAVLAVLLALSLFKRGQRTAQEEEARE